MNRNYPLEFLNFSAQIAEGGKRYDEGTTVPSDGTAGYAKGCLFRDTDASAGAMMYVNNGTASSCDFDEVSDLRSTQTVSGQRTTTAAQSHSGAQTFDDMIETDFNPYTRVWVRTDFPQALGVKARMSDWSVFNSVQSRDLHWIISGSGEGAVTGFVGNAQSDGATYLNNSSASSAFVWMKPRIGSPAQKIHWSTSKAPRFRAVIKTGAAITANKVVIGFNSGSGKPARFVNGTNTKNRLGIYLDKVADSNWRAEAAMSTTASSSASCGIVVAADTLYDIELRLSTARIATVYINSTLVATFTTALKASKRLVPTIGVQTEDAAGTTAANQGINVYHVLLSQNINAT